MYTTVFYKENEDGYELVMTQESGGKPKFKDAKFPYYVQEGEFDGVVDPSKGLDNRTREERLEDENAKLKADNEMNAMAIMELTDMFLGG